MPPANAYFPDGSRLPSSGRDTVVPAGTLSFRSSGVTPGVIATDMTSGVKEKYDKLIAEGLTVDKRWGTPADVGSAVAVLARGELPYATGQVLNIDGGMTLQRL